MSGGVVKSESLRTKVHLSFMDNIWGPNLADTQLISKFKKKAFGFYCVLLIYLREMLGLFL